MPEYYSQDITFCSNRKCKNKKCERHYSHINWAVKPYQSLADFENTQYCPKKKKESDNNAECKYCYDEFCTNDKCPLVADYCPVPNDPDVCKWEERGVDNAE